MRDCSFVCPNCGQEHFTSSFCFYAGEGFNDEPKKLDHILNFSLTHYEAVGESRELAKGPLLNKFPKSQVLNPNLQHLVHRYRCFARRPKMSLVQRVRQVMKNRKKSKK